MAGKVTIIEIQNSEIHLSGLRHYTATVCKLSLNIVTFQASYPAHGIEGSSYLTVLAWK